jgi:hypothetical protein
MKVSIRPCIMGALHCKSVLCPRGTFLATRGRLVGDPLKLAGITNMERRILNKKTIRPARISTIYYLTAISNKCPLRGTGGLPGLLRLLPNRRGEYDVVEKQPDIPKNKAGK